MAAFLTAETREEIASFSRLVLRLHSCYHIFSQAFDIHLVSSYLYDDDTRVKRYSAPYDARFPKLLIQEILQALAADG